MRPSSLSAKKIPWDSKKFQLQALTIFIVFSAALLVKIPILKPSLREALSPIGSQEVFTLFILYTAPFLFLVYCLITQGKNLHFRRFDLIYGLITLMHLVSFFWINRGFQPVNPILTNISAFFLYLLIRNLHSHQLRNQTLFLLAIPLIPLSAEACHGLLQAYNGIHPVLGPFFNYNFLGMLLAMGAPIAVSQILSGNKGLAYRFISLSFACLLLFGVFLTTSRTASCGFLIATAIALSIFYRRMLKTIWTKSKLFIKIPTVTAVLLAACSGMYFAYSLRPLSVWARLHLFKLGLYMFFENLLTGIGFGEIFPRLSEFQGKYFSQGFGNGTDRILAGNPGAVTSEYLERAVETGILGLLLYIPFWFLILRTIFILINRESAHPKQNPGLGGGISALRELGYRILLGERSNMACFGAGTVILLFMFMSLSYSPSRILQINLLFSYFLGIAVSLSESRGKAQKNLVETAK